MQVVVLHFPLKSLTFFTFLKAIRIKKKKQNKIVMPARSKLISLESRISKTLINNEISHEDFVTILNEEKRIERKH